MTKFSVLLLHSGVDLLGADQVVLGTEDGTNIMAVPNGTVVIDTGRSDSDWHKVMLLSDYHMLGIYAVHEEEPDTWYVDPEDVKKSWTVSEEVLEGKLLPKFEAVVPAPVSEATKAALNIETDKEEPSPRLNEH